MKVFTSERLGVYTATVVATDRKDALEKLKRYAPDLLKDLKVEDLCEVQESDSIVIFHICED